MVNALGVRNKIEIKVFDALGSTATLQTKSAQTIDKWGDSSETYGTATSIVVVPWSNFSSNKKYEGFGESDAGDIDLAIKYNQTINVDDKLTWNTKVYKVKSIQYYTMKDTLLVKAIRLTEVLS